MIKNIQLCMTREALLSYELDGTQNYLSMSDLKRQCGDRISDITSSEVESAGAKAYKNDQILIYATVAQGQGGIALIWDASNRTVLHLSDAPFAQAIATDGQDVFVFEAISAWGQKPTICITSAPYGVINNDVAMVLECDIPFSVEDFFSNANSHGRFEMDFVDGSIVIRLGDQQKYHLSLSEINVAKRSTMITALQSAGVRAIPTVVTMDMGLQYDYITPKGAGTVFGDMGSWPIWRFSGVSKEKWDVIISAIKGNALTPDLVEETGLDDMLYDVHSVEDHTYAEILNGLLDIPWTGNDFFCLFDSGAWYEHTSEPRFFLDQGAVAEAFAESYCSSIVRWEDMDDSTLEEWFSRLNNDLSRLYFQAKKD